MAPCDLLLTDGVTIISRFTNTDVGALKSMNFVTGLPITFEMGIISQCTMTYFRFLSKYSKASKKHSTIGRSRT